MKLIKKLICITGAAAAGLAVAAAIKKSDSVYKNDESEKNPMEGKKVRFVENEDEPANADGVCGHLEAIEEDRNDECTGTCGCYSINGVDDGFNYTHKIGFYEKYLKRGLDVALSFGGLVALSPVLLGLSVAIYIDDPGPILFTQKRIGKNKQYFKLHKFRSMKMSTPHDKPTHMLDNPEQYITRVGKFIRSHSLDELPQIWDIFIGNMSVIGPRPALWNQDLLVAERDKYGANDVKPGLTGWAQINGRDELEIPDKAKLDGEYVEKISKGSLKALTFDIKCFLGTFLSVLRSDGVVEGGTGEIHKKEKTVSVDNGYTLRPGVPAIDPSTPLGCDMELYVDETATPKVLITGAGSYIGESVKEYASEHYPNITFDTLDMLDADWRDYDFSSYDTVYHVAGIAHADVGKVSDEQIEKYYSVNTDLAIEVANKAKSAGVHQFIFMSSMIVYGDSAPIGKEKMIDRNTVPEPANFYGDSKWQADKGVRALADDKFKVAVLRPPMIYGKGSKGNYPILSKLAKKLPIFPDIENKRSMLHIDNLCEFMCKLILCGEGGIYFPQNKEYTKTSDLVAEIRRASHKKSKNIKALSPAVKIAYHIPGKARGLVNKAFGNNCYDQELSKYSFEYSLSTLNDSIKKTEL